MEVSSKRNHGLVYAAESADNSNLFVYQLCKSGVATPVVWPGKVAALRNVTSPPTEVTVTLACPE